MRRLQALGFGMVALATACGSCEDGDGRLVPFGIDAGQEGPEAPEPTEEPPFSAVEGQRLPEGTRAVAVEGAELQANEGHFAALLPLDMEGDGDRDALLLVHGDEGYGLTLAIRQGSSFELRTLGNFAAPAPCALDDVSMRTVAAKIAVVKAGFRCNVETREDRWGALWILSVDRNPRVLERITMLPEHGRAPGTLDANARAADHDADGHMDVLVDFRLTTPDQAEPITTTLIWLDRPSGLGRVPGQPEGDIVALADRAKAVSATSTAAAVARSALALHAALCRGDSAPRIRLGGADGVDCGVSSGAGRAVATLSASLARQGNLLGAIEAFQRVRQGGLRVAGADERAAERAILALAQAPTERQGPMASPPEGPDVRLPGLTFADATTVFVPGTPPQLWNFETDEVTSAPGKDRELLVSDRSRRFAVVDIRRSCDGYTLAIVRVEDVTGNVVIGQPVSEPLLESKAPPRGARCPELPRATREQDGGWKVLGWAPQGVVAARGVEVRLVPLSEQAEAAGEPRVLRAGPLPAPLPAGRYARAGHAHAAITSFGITVVELRGEGRAVLLRPEGWSAEAASDVIISDDGARVAYLGGGRARLMEIDWSAARPAIAAD